MSANGDVLVLEAGRPDDRREMSIPLAYPELWGSAVDWEFRTLPQSELDDRSLAVRQGKTLGGSSSITAQLYFRAHVDRYTTGGLWPATTAGTTTPSASGSSGSRTGPASPTGPAGHSTSPSRPTHIR